MTDAPAPSAPAAWTAPTPSDWRGWLARPELALVAESCAAERSLHAALRADPRRPVEAAAIERLADPDARENWRHFVRLRDAVEAAGSWEAWLLERWRAGVVDVPPLFLDDAVERVVRTLLAGCDDAWQWRAAEMLSRPQRLTRQDGRWLAGDRRTLDLQRETHGFGELGRLLAQGGQPLKAVSLQVLGPDNAAAYLAERTVEPVPGAPARHRFVLDLTHTLTQDWGHGLTVDLTAAHSGLQALARVLERWVDHLLGVRVRIEPRARIDDAQWRWHVGLDAVASALLDDLYTGRAPVDDARRQRLVSLFVLTFDEPSRMRADVAGRPVYLALAAADDGTLRLKPQNLLLNLPLAPAS